MSTSLYQATPPLPIPNSFTKAIRICFYFVLLFIHAVISWRDQFVGLVSANLLETATNAFLAAQKEREKNEKVSPQGVIT